MSLYAKRALGFIARAVTRRSQERTLRYSSARQTDREVGLGDRRTCRGEVQAALASSGGPDRGHARVSGPLGCNTRRASGLALRGVPVPTHLLAQTATA